MTKKTRTKSILSNPPKLRSIERAINQSIESSPRKITFQSFIIIFKICQTQSNRRATYQASKGDLEGEPRVARVLHVKEQGVRTKIVVVVPRLLPVALEAKAQHREADEKYRDARYALGSEGRVRLVEQCPHPRPRPLPPRQPCPLPVLLVEAEKSRDLLLAQPLTLHVQFVEDRQSRLSVPVSAVRAPTAWLHLEPGITGSQPPSLYSKLIEKLLSHCGIGEYGRYPWRATWNIMVN